MRWRAGARPEKGKHRAIAEVPTWTKADGTGHADYVLFAGLTPVGVVEAKKLAKKIPSALDQSKRYARGLAAVTPPELVTKAAEGGETFGWATSFVAPAAAPRYQVPFLYATNGRPYLRQLETESGVWFHDIRHPSNHPRALTGWHTPEVLLSMLAHDPEAAQAKLAANRPTWCRRRSGCVRTRPRSATLPRATSRTGAAPWKHRLKRLSRGHGAAESGATVSHPRP